MGTQDFLCSRGSVVTEAKTQTKILGWLKDNGFYAIKVVIASKSGITDIVGCTPQGQFFCIEVKHGKNVATPLQLWNIGEVNKRGGIGFVAYDLDTVKQKLGSFALKP
jgi:hypothetical protein